MIGVVAEYASIIVNGPVVLALLTMGVPAFVVGRALRVGAAAVAADTINPWLVVPRFLAPREVLSRRIALWWEESALAG